MFGIEYFSYEMEHFLSEILNFNIKIEQNSIKTLDFNIKIGNYYIKTRHYNIKIEDFNIIIDRFLSEIRLCKWWISEHKYKKIT